MATVVCISSGCLWNMYVVPVWKVNMYILMHTDYYISNQDFNLNVYMDIRLYFPTTFHMFLLRTQAKLL